MKKSLLLSVLGMAAFSAYALQDVTPANYKFYNLNEFKYHNLVYGTSNFDAPVWETIKGDQYFNEGLIAITGAVVQWGKNGSTPLDIMETTAGPHLVAGTSLVDLGGEVGKVLCISGCNSKINDRLQELYGVDMNIPNMTGGVEWFSLNFFGDPTTLTRDGSEDYYNVRCRVTCNFFYNFPNGMEDGVSLVNAFLVENQNNNVGSDNKICTDWFVKMNEDQEPIDDQGEVSEEQYYWNPETWLQYEVNIKIKPDEDGVSYCPVRLKYDIKANSLQNGTMFIRSVEFFIPSKEEAQNNGTPSLKFINMRPDPKGAGVGSVMTDRNESLVNVNGNVATFVGDATVYNLTGAVIAKTAAHQGVNLAPGVYVANVGGKNVKFMVK